MRVMIAQPAYLLAMKCLSFKTLYALGELLPQRE
jgi:hypothetical protein